MTEIVVICPCGYVERCLYPDCAEARRLVAGKRIEALWREYHALPETHYSKRGKVIGRIRAIEALLQNLNRVSSEGVSAPNSNKSGTSAP